MFSSGVQSLKTYGSGALAFAVIALLAGVLIERRVLTGRPASAAMAATPAPGASGEDLLPGLRRIVLDPCTGLEKPQTRARTAKVD